MSFIAIYDLFNLSREDSSPTSMSLKRYLPVSDMVVLPKIDVLIVLFSGISSGSTTSCRSLYVC